MRNRFVGKSRARRGSALVTALLVVVVLAGVAASVFGVSAMRNQEARRAGQEMRALYLAETGLTESLVEVAVNKRDSQPVPAQLGTKTAPRKMRKGAYWSDLADNGDGTYTATSTGSAIRSTRAIQAVIEPFGKSVFDHAIFAGNSSGDPTYRMKLSGGGSEADYVDGDVYSGGDIDLLVDASVSGTISAQGTISGASGEEGISFPLPDIAGQNYSTNHDFDVASEFVANGYSASNSLGGTADQVPEANPAHIFRKNPTDRGAEIAGTVKDDYFLEDPYEAVTDHDSWYSAYRGHTVTLSGIDGATGPDGNEAVYYIDGNLWIHNGPWRDMRINRGSDPTRLTFVVRGNIYFSDNVTVIDMDTDALAFIAIKDSAEPDSGNIYLGDPIGGTVERIEAFLYAENDFVDFNLSASGSKRVDLIGNMTAGNQVRIERDFTKSDGTEVHSQLRVDFDDRLSTGELDLPGIPGTNGNIDGYRIAFWQELPLGADTQVVIK